MNLTFSQEDLKFKEEVKDFISKNLDRTIQKKINNGHHISKDDLVNWQKKLYEKGGMAPGVLTVLSAILCYGLADKIYI